MAAHLCVSHGCTQPLVLTRARRHPAALIASRVSKDLRGNLAAVRDHAEELGESAVALPKMLQAAK